MIRVSVIAVAMVGIIATALPAKAVDWPWCATTYGDSAVTTCGFASLQQCQAYISGMWGDCHPNARYRGERSPRRNDRWR